MRQEERNNLSGDPENNEFANLESELSLIGFALTECVVRLDTLSAKHLRAVHRTALELAVPNRFGIESGGFWLTQEQIAQLRRLPEYYPPNEAQVVAQTIEAYLKAQLHDFYFSTVQSREAADIRSSSVQP